jgi:hypothetical protein
MYQPVEGGEGSDLALALEANSKLIIHQPETSNDKTNKLQLAKGTCRCSYPKVAFR